MSARRTLEKEFGLEQGGDAEIIQANGKSDSLDGLGDFGYDDQELDRLLLSQMGIESIAHAFSIRSHLWNVPAPVTRLANSCVRDFYSTIGINKLGLYTPTISNESYISPSFIMRPLWCEIEALGSKLYKVDKVPGKLSKFGRVSLLPSLLSLSIEQREQAIRFCSRNHLLSARGHVKYTVEAASNSHLSVHMPNDFTDVGLRFLRPTIETWPISGLESFKEHLETEYRNFAPSITMAFESEANDNGFNSPSPAINLSTMFLEDTTAEDDINSDIMASSATSVSTVESFISDIKLVGATEEWKGLPSLAIGARLLARKLPLSKLTDNGDRPIKWCTTAEGLDFISQFLF